MHPRKNARVYLQMLLKLRNADTILSFFCGRGNRAEISARDSQLFNRTWSELVDIRAKDVIILFAAV